MSDQVPSPSDRLRQMASDYERAVSEARSEQIAARAIARARPRGLLSRRLVALASGLSILVLSMVALGSTVTRSLPGDPLYGINRAYQEIGARFGVVDPVERRLSEFIGLVNRGDHARAAQVGAEVLTELEQSRGIKVSLPQEDPATADTKNAESEASNDTASANAETAAAETSDQGASAKLAAESLQANLNDNGEELVVAATEFAKAVTGLSPEEPVIAVGTTTTTTTTTPEGTTTTSTSPGDTTTTTTVPDSTTTTQVGGESSDSGPGPIFLPPSP